MALAPGYAANVEVARRRPAARGCRRADGAAERSTRPVRRRSRRSPARSAFRPAPAQGVPGRHRRRAASSMVVVRGDHRVNEIKLANTLGERVPARARRRDRRAHRARPASSGPVGRRARRCSTPPSTPRAARSRAPTSPTDHLAGVEPGRDFASSASTSAASRRATASTAAAIRIEPAIEIGNIFQLGTRYSEPLGATYLDESGGEQPIVDGLLRHRPGAHRRRRGGAVRRRARASRGRGRSRRGTSRSSRWARPARAELAAAEALHEELRAAGLAVAARRSRRGHGREVRRRRAARRAAAADRREAVAGVGHGRGEGPSRQPRIGGGSRSTAPPRRWPSCGTSLP